MQKEESGSEFAKEGIRVRTEIIKPILERAASKFRSSWASSDPEANAEAGVEVKLPGPGIGLWVRTEGDSRQLTFSFGVTPRKVRVTYNDARDEELLMDEPKPLSEVTPVLVQSYTDTFLAPLIPE